MSDPSGTASNVAGFILPLIPLIATFEIAKDVTKGISGKPVKKSKKRMKSLLEDPIGDFDF